MTDVKIDEKVAKDHKSKIQTFEVETEEAKRKREEEEKRRVYFSS
jgi:hypothetical protein